VIVSALVTTGAFAAGGASVKIVLPHNAHAHHKFTYTIKGTFTSPAGAWVIGLSQPTTAPCRSSAPADSKGPSAPAVEWKHVTGSPFTLQVKWYGLARKSRRVCVYLYKQMFLPLGKSEGAELLATAQTLVVK
jgi:hypothetical protein